MKSNFQSLKRRIKSVRSTLQVTTAMKTVAVSKHNRCLEKGENFGAYYSACEDLLQKIGTSPDNGFENRGDKILYVMFTANRGLCGTYNSDIMRFFEEQKENNGNYRLLVCGKWGENYCTAKKVKNVIGSFTMPDIPEYNDAVNLSNYLKDLYEKDTEIGKIVFITQIFKNILSQQPDIVPFLPVENKSGDENVRAAFTPEREIISKTLLNLCLNAAVYKVMLNAAAGAHGAMFAAMRTAAQNCAKMLTSLELEYNRMRQATVTTQVLEVASGNFADNTDKGGE